MHTSESIQARVSEVYRQLQQNPVGRYYINDLAKQAGLTPEVFNKTFKEMHGLTVPQCITQAKMQRATSMLAAGHSIKAVSAALQYKQVINFHKTFKRVMGLTPKQYCQQLKKLLSSRIFWFYIKHTSKPYGSSYYSLSKNYIQNFGIMLFSADDKNYVLKESDTNKLDLFFEKKYGVTLPLNFIT